MGNYTKNGNNNNQNSNSNQRTNNQQKKEDLNARNEKARYSDDEIARARYLDSKAKFLVRDRIHNDNIDTRKKLIDQVIMLILLLSIPIIARPNTKLKTLSEKNRKENI